MPLFSLMLASGYKPHINLVFSSWWSLAIFFGLFFGFIWWITSMYRTQRKILKAIKKMVTREEMDAAFEEFKREIKGE